MNDVLFSSKKMDWETPSKLFTKLDNIFNFTLDVAANKFNRKCDNFYTVETDGLKRGWKQNNGAVWCNPPYGREISKWVEKAYLESISHDTTIVMLLPARTDTKYFHDYIYGKAEIFFLKGRLKFLDAEHKENHPAPFPSMIVIYNFNREDLSNINKRVEEV
ncbi:DNA N-6-adenine-methyltransferase [Filifactor alocis]